MDNKLFTPGPLNTKLSVKEAMLHDMGSRDKEFLEVVKEIRDELLEIAGVTREEGYDAVLMQGSGTFGVESVISTALPPNGHLLLLSNGAYGDRIRQMAEIYGIKTSTLSYLENIVPPAQDVKLALKTDETITHVAIVHCETTNTLEACYGNARTISLNLYGQWIDIKKNNQFRFTPPIQSVLAFRKAIEELKAEGGIEKRSERYQQNYRRLIEGTEVLGLKTYLDKKDQGYIITSFLFPEHPNFDFTLFYEKLHQRGHVIYQGKLSDTNCFRIGNIGQLYVEDIDRLLLAIQDVLTEMEVTF
jgi:2-aminoethylphosphonate-pyruvate transaminase